MRLFSAIIVGLLLILGCSSQDAKVVKKDSGLMYADDTLGTGRVAKMGDLITIHFDAWKIEDSTNLFTDWNNDTTRKASSIGGTRVINKPLKYALGKEQFIKGSDEGIEGMKVGGWRTIIIPAKLAYKDKGFGPIPPNTSIKLFVELLDVKDPIIVQKWDVDKSKFKTTKDGLQYAIIENGEGAKIDSGDVVKLHYSGFYTDGKKFDSSVERDEPLEFQYKVQPFIKGFQEGLGFMRKGTKAELIVPSDLAYGPGGNGKIPPNSTLVFDIQILDVQK